MPRQGESLGKYELMRRIGLGGMAEVWLARVSGPGGFTKNLVVKTVLEHHAQNEEFVAQFFDEARLAALLTHPNIAQIFELGEHKGIYFIAMEYVRGQDLQAIRKAATERGEGLPYPLLARIVCGVCEGLHYAHSLADEDGRKLSLVHRDVSPENILISYDGVVKIVDFGIAKATINQVTTRAGLFKGKLQFAAPQRFLNLPIDRRDDIYSLGAVVYKAATGVAPINADSDGMMIKKILDGEFPPPSQFRADTPEEFERIVIKSMEWDPVDRYQSCRDMQQDLEQYITNTGTPVTTFEVSQFMRKCFIDELEKSSLEIDISADIAEEEELPADGDPPSTVFGLGGQQKPIRDDIRTVMGHHISEEKVLSPSKQVIVESDARRDRSYSDGYDDEDFRPSTLRLVVIICAVALVVLVGVGFLLWAPWSGDGADQDSSISTLIGNETSTTTEAGSPADASGTTQPGREDAAVEVPEDTGSPANDAAVVPAGDSGRGDSDLSKVDSTSLVAEKGTGTVSIEGPSGCSARFGDKKLGSLPVRHELEVGEHKIKVRCPYAVRRELNVKIRAGEVTTETVRLRDGSLQVLVRPWAEVYINGRKRGITPMGAISLPEGRHSVRLVNTKLNVTKNRVVRIRGGQTTKLRVIMQ